MDSKYKYIRWSAVFMLIVGSILITINLQGEKRTGISGRIVSAYGPLEDARVRIPGHKTFVKTGKGGEFSVPTGTMPSRRIRITAGKEGWFNNGDFIRGGRFEIFLNPLPRTDNPDYRFLPPKICSQCHVKLSKIYDRSKMARTTSNPRVLQMYNGTDAFNRKKQGPGFKLDNPNKDGDCIACHAPSVDASNPQTKDLNKALFSPKTGENGISCDYCHKIKRIVKSKTSSSGFKAILQRNKPISGNSILVFGPYDDVVVPPMAASYSPLFNNGRYCSQCHSHILKSKNLKKQDWQKIYTKEEWKGFGLEDETYIPVQTTYQEWKQWQEALPKNDADKGKNCQDCHMSWRKNMLPYDSFIVNGHAKMMWGSFRQSQSIHPHQFDGGTETQLKTAVTMEIDGEIKGNILTITVFITNTSGGHWIPTGEPMRRIILLLKATDENEKPMIPISGSRLPDIIGKGDPAKEFYAGLPGVLFAKILKDSEGNMDVPFWQADAVDSDNRIRPKTTVSLKWQFRLQHPDEEPSIKALLIYRSASKKLAKTKKWRIEDIVMKETAW